ncbi:hypothetical protein ACRPK0_09970 [Limosilactobacillus reuteri]|uniref:hypothetical protein n=1 Tax=Limosilactobacillus reuteri TaxID=1598 RepID=UPI003D785F7A
MKNNVLFKGNKEVNVSELLFFTSYSIYLIFALLELTEINPSRTLFGIIRIITFLIILFKIFLYDSKFLKFIFSFFVLLFISYLTARNSGNFALVDAVILIYGAKGISFEKIVDVYVVIATTLVVIITLLSIMGFIQNNITVRNNVYRSSFGFMYPTVYIACITYIIIADLYNAVSKHKNLIIRYFIYLLVSLYSYIFCNARLGTITILLTIVFGMYAQHYLKVKRMNKIIEFFIHYSFTIFALISVLIVYMYIRSPYNSFLSNLDSLLTGRLYFSKMGVITYGYSLFGQKIPMVVNGSGIGSLAAGNTQAYFFIDSSYMNIALCYGIISLIIICLAFNFLNGNLLKKTYSILPIFLFLVALNSAIGEQMSQICVNVFLLAFFSLHDNVGFKNESNS